MLSRLVTLGLLAAVAPRASSQDTPTSIVVYKFSNEAASPEVSKEMPYTIYMPTDNGYAQQPKPYQEDHATYTHAPHVYDEPPYHAADTREPHVYDEPPYHTHYTHAPQEDDEPPYHTPYTHEPGYYNKDPHDDGGYANKTAPMHGEKPLDTHMDSEKPLDTHMHGEKPNYSHVFGTGSSWKHDEEEEEASHPPLRVGPDPNDPLAPYLLPDTHHEPSPMLHSLARDLRSAALIPDVLSESFVPQFALSIQFGDPVALGELLTLNQTRNEPTVEFDAPPAQRFTVMIVDPDAPSISRHGYRSYRHYLVANLGEDSAGDVVTEYHPPQPSFGSGAHRYAVLVFRQPNEILHVKVPHSRVRFNPLAWARQYKMDPVAASYFLVRRRHAHE
ncbi:hypothetical protein GGF46_004835 [Coemansia sp. RSA 552]|nr:hypothetical protein GGF46_004835 [Coemansia sp. RSA 552]